MNHLAVVFPGQGSQTLGMLSGLAEAFPVVQQTFEEASDILGSDLWSCIQNGPVERLNQTEVTQVAMLVSDVAVYRVLQAQSLPVVAMMAGHSLGEYAALVCSNALTFGSAVKLVQQRAQLMQASMPLGVGAMAAIVGLADAAVDALCQAVSRADCLVSVANYNTIGQVVIAGHRPAVDEVMQQAEQAGARLVMLLPVSVPCHCELLRAASTAFESSLLATSFQQPDCPVLSNVDALPYAASAQIPLYLAKQLYSPVQWVKTIQYMIAEGVDAIIECGPGQVLTGLVKRIDRQLAVASVNDVQGLEKVLGWLA